MTQGTSILEMIDHYEADIDRYLNRGPDPRGPAGISQATGWPIWPTQALWVIGGTLCRISKTCRTAGFPREADRAAEVLRELHGRAQSPEELAAMMAATGTPDA